jgi:predicted metal-dependent HD superfamily phosphohydrolase
LGQFIGGQRTEDVKRLIISTDPKRPRSGNADEDILIDLDLSILGSAPEDYETYRVAVRREYALVSDEDFTAGRRSVLQRFLTHRIYATDFFAQLESQARANIESELKDLG